MDTHNKPHYIIVDVVCLGCEAVFQVRSLIRMLKGPARVRYGWCGECREMELPRRATQNRLYLPVDRSSLRPL